MPTSTRDPDHLGGVVVTGASSGIGAAAAVELGRKGYSVACLSRRGTLPSEAEGNLRGYACDVTDHAAVEHTLREFADGAGGISGLVNNAGQHREQPSATLPLDELRELMELNFVSAFAMCQQAYPYLKQQGGLIVNMGSFYDKLGVRSNLAYSASKSAVESMTRTLAVEWARDGIQVLTIAPGYILTELNREWFENTKNREAVERRIPLRRIGQADEVGRLVAGLFEMRAPFLTGETIHIDGAESISL